MRIFSKIYRVSHSRERAEKTCLNCNTALYGRYCHVCGQENINPRESFWSIITHFFNDFTHFDGKFFKTTGKLLSKPGFLPLEYINGRRVRYLHPIRMYIFTSAVFFLIFYSWSAPHSAGGTSPFNPLDTIVEITNRERPFKTVAEYDSVQQTLPQNKRDGWLGSKIMRRNIERNQKYGGRGDMIVDSLVNNFLHTFPYLLFVSLPIMAFFLQLLYFRNRNNVYSGHAIFLVYLYIFSFLVMLAYFGLVKLRSLVHSGWISWLTFALFLYMGVYTLIAFKNFYGQRWGRTIFKFIIWNILALVTVLLLFAIFFAISLLKV